MMKMMFGLTDSSSAAAQIELAHEVEDKEIIAKQAM